MPKSSNTGEEGSQSQPGQSGDGKGPVEQAVPGIPKLELPVSLATTSLTGKTQIEPFPAEIPSVEHLKPDPQLEIAAGFSPAETEKKEAEKTRREVITTASVLAASAACASICSIVGIVFGREDHNEDAKRQVENRIDEISRATSRLGNFQSFCALLSDKDFRVAYQMAENIAYAADADKDRGKYFVWQSNKYICQAISGDFNSVLNLSRILQEATTWGARQKGYGDWLYAASLDLIYIKLTFLAANPRYCSTNFEIEAYSKLNGLFPVAFSKVKALEYCCLHLFELSPAWAIEESKIRPSFLKSKVLCLDKQYGQALSLLQNECVQDWAGCKDVLAKIGLAQPMVLSSLGESDNAIAKANNVNISWVQDRASIAHLETVPALFSGKVDALADSLATQAEFDWPFFAPVLNGDCSTFLAGEPAKRVQHNYAAAGLHAYAKSEFKGAAEICWALKKIRDAY